MLQRALEPDPHFARAWTGLAWAYFIKRTMQSDGTVLKQKALDAARRALQLDPMDAEAHAALGRRRGIPG